MIIFNILCTGLLALLLNVCRKGDIEHKIVISVPDQKMIVLDFGMPVAEYPVSTSKYGLGDKPGSRATPEGKFEIAQKIGDNAPSGEVFKKRRPTGEILHPDVARCAAPRYS